MFETKNKGAVDLLCSIVKYGAEIKIERFSSGETVVVSKDGELYLKQTGELLSKKQFLQRLMVMPDDPVSLSLRRSDVMPEYQQYSNTQIARKRRQLTCVDHDRNVGRWKRCLGVDCRRHAKSDTIIRHLLAQNQT